MGQTSPGSLCHPPVRVASVGPAGCLGGTQQELCTLVPRFASAWVPIFRVIPHFSSHLCVNCRWCDGRPTRDESQAEEEPRERVGLR